MNRQETSTVFSAADAERLALELYGLEVFVKPLVGYSDQNFYLGDAGGKEFVLKIANREVGREVLEAQNAALEHIARKSGNICSTVIPTREGGRVAEVADRNGALRFVRVLSYIPGKDIRDTGYTDDVVDDFGRFLGTLTHSLADFDHPALHKYEIWDAKNAMDMERYCVDIVDPGQRELSRLFLNRFKNAAVPLFPHLRSSIIHNDANDFNILVNEDEQRVGGIIDFEDMTYSYIVCELAIAAAYAIHYQENPLQKITRLTAAFHQVYPLTEAEQEALFYLIPARLCATVIMGRQQQIKYPDNPYVMISVPPAWDALEKMAQLDPEQGIGAIKKACREKMEGRRVRR